MKRLTTRGNSLKKLNVKRVLVGASIGCLALAAGNKVVNAQNPLSRIYGNGRIQTAIKIAEENWTNLWKDSKTAIIAPASNENLIDALSVSPLSYKLNAPILLNDKKDSINKDTLNELKTKGIKTVYIATGEGVISKNAEQTLKNAGIITIRLGGKNRFETTQNIYNAFKEKGGTNTNVALVAPNALSDALSISSIAAKESMPILLTDSKGTAVYSTMEPVVKGASKVYVVGGTSVIKDSLRQKYSAVRLGGNNRFETNAQVINTFAAQGKLDFSKVYLANGLNSHLVDALTGSVLAAQYKSPVILVSSTLDPSLKGVLKGKVTETTSIVSFGGTSVVTDKVVQKVVDVNKKDQLQIISVE